VFFYLSVDDIFFSRKNALILDFDGGFWYQNESSCNLSGIKSEKFKVLIKIIGNYKKNLLINFNIIIKIGHKLLDTLKKCII